MANFHLCNNSIEEIVNEKTISVLAIVSSSPDHFAKRLAIRQTWKNQLMLSNYKSGNITSSEKETEKTLRFQLIFQVGLHPSSDSINRQVIQETDDYGDVLLQDFQEHYNNLSVKSVMILKYVTEDLNIRPNFIFKVCNIEKFSTYLFTHLLF